MRLIAVPAAVTAPPAGPPTARGDAADAPRRLRLGQRLWRFLHTPKGLLLLVFLPLLLVGGGAPGWPATLPHVVAAVVGAVLVDLLVACVALRPAFWPSGALLSGLIVAFVLGPETAWPATLLVGALATASKHLLRWRRLQLFNPAALALLVSVPLFGAGQSWWGALAERPWPWALLLLAGGVLVVDRVNRFPLVLAFTGAYFALLTLAGLVAPAAAAELFRPPFLQAALFLALFMLTDPPTAPARPAEQVGIGLLGAAVACLAQALGAGQTYLLLGLLAGNLALAGRRWFGAQGALGAQGGRDGTPSKEPARG
jgi:Na+-translocating ferredoxin:NAD+ oxidoreductase RnfD subunit